MLSHGFVSSQHKFFDKFMREQARAFSHVQHFAVLAHYNLAFLDIELDRTAFGAFLHKQFRQFFRRDKHGNYTDVFRVRKRDFFLVAA